MNVILFLLYSQISLSGCSSLCESLQMMKRKNMIKSERQNINSNSEIQLFSTFFTKNALKLKQILAIIMQKIPFLFPINCQNLLTLPPSYSLMLITFVQLSFYIQIYFPDENANSLSAQLRLFGVLRIPQFQLLLISYKFSISFKKLPFFS
ncbi:hypothetical protein TTHERM_000731389 (macronuclear) [Tetrahymena thermophila SB210]|uniref:Transmembrane protein n=1 Tax=Tetrahymena thermophila (strain SB210) TaxID=312017 RepID=W7X3W8_TETTS|nr:hypothetical protein TTHERM_000731389 [Tetrahymena thermophila SB210]EWS72132.1 hypothetical protein TTHERM_000731389 [Tetrahymena thermophila SB210]|eukprot:XP_012655325.1 hypothetical protein TTHERM_000731389 [Tetrahymena thermophila SB210]